MPCCSTYRPMGRPWRWLSGVSLALALGGIGAGCLPELEGQCSVDSDCPAARPICVSAVCTPAIDGVDATSDGIAPGDLGRADGGADGMPPDRGVEAGVDASGPCTPAGPETCNGVDDDCDGQTDEVAGGQPLSRPCYTGDPATQGMGVCRAGRATCAGGAYGACEGEQVPRDEVCADGAVECDGLCNGEDDDCDGAVDEGLVQSCGPDADIGLCRRGMRACTDGFWQTCEGAVPPAVEICDGLDNDCDEELDEGAGDCRCAVGENRPCYSGAPGTAGVGVCESGQQDCTAEGTYGQCFDEVTPLPEVCDGEDNDCDGQPDEWLGGQECTVGIGACARAGVTACDARARQERCDAVAGQPVDELCNGIDDDCDGTVDEGFRLAEACSRGVGACQVVGERICRDDRAVCDAVAGDPGDEVCDGEDDDCDGTIDEGPDSDGPLEQGCYEHDEGNPGVGACTEGVQACVAGRWGQCVGDQQPFAERCNQIDDDCNGEIDDVEGGDCSCTVGQEQPCYGGPEDTAGIGVCRRGMQRCVEIEGGGTGFGPCDGERLPGDEECTGADDDCDGAVDEGTFGDCSAGQGACAVEGEVRCIDRTLQCDAVAAEPADEVCDGADNNCNGVIDDIPPTPCGVGQGVCANTGGERCGADGVECDAAPGEPAGDEVCNGDDDDCDGAVDEDIAGGPCDAGLGICAAEGREQCVDGQLVCEGATGDPQIETCDGADDDCDGDVDEDPQALCADPQNATSACVAAACDLTCVVGFIDHDTDPATGCERGCGDRVDGAALPATGLPLDVAARPDVDAFAIAWLDADGRPWMSLDGGAAFTIGGAGDIRGETIRLLGVRNGYSALVFSRDGSWAVDVDVSGQAPVIDVFGGDNGIQGLFMAYRQPNPLNDDDDVPGLAAGAAVDDQGEGSLVQYPRRFGADFGVGAILEQAGDGWLPQSISATVVGDQPVLAGVAVENREAADVRVIFVGGFNRLETRVAGAANNQTRTAIGARGTSIVLGVSGNQGAAAFGFDAADMLLGAPLDIAGTGSVRGVQFGPFGPVINGLANNDLVSVGLELGPVGLAPVFGPTPVVGLDRPGSGRIEATASTLTTGDQRIIVWRDPQGNVRYALNPCR